MGQATEYKTEAYKNYYRKGQKKMENTDEKETLPDVLRGLQRIMGHIHR
jgi:hypothetical protein